MSGAVKQHEGGGGGNAEKHKRMTSLNGLDDLLTSNTEEG